MRLRWFCSSSVSGCAGDRVVSRSIDDAAVGWVSSSRGSEVRRCRCLCLVFVRVTVRGWFVEGGVIGQCVMVCCNSTVDVEVEGVEMAIASAGAGIGMLWGRVCGEHRCGGGVNDGGHASVTDVEFYLVVNVGVSA